MTRKPPDVQRGAAREAEVGTRDTLRPPGAFAVPPQAEARPKRETTMRPPGRGAVPPPSVAGGLARVRGGSAKTTREGPRHVAPPPTDKRHERSHRSALTSPYFSRVPADAAETYLDFSAPGLFKYAVVSFDPVLPSGVFARTRPRPRSAAEPAVAEAPQDSSRKAHPAEDLPAPGAILEKFRLEELLGVGGFAAVYRATHLLLQTPVAIKMLRPSVLLRKPRLAQALYNEARFAARINHPNVVRILDVTHTPSITFVVMEYVHGESLARVIERGPLRMPQVLRLGLELAAGLEAGLKEGLLHRDVKPANVMLSTHGSAKIVDFGLAAPRTTPEFSRGVHDEAVWVGTHGYMAPEISSRGSVDFRGDIYSLGVTLYQATVGRLPFWHADLATCLRLQREAPVPEPHRLRADVPRPWSDLLLTLLASRPEARLQSYAELQAAIRSVARSLDETNLQGAP